MYEQGRVLCAFSDAKLASHHCLFASQIRWIVRVSTYVGKTLTKNRLLSLF